MDATGHDSRDAHDFGTNGSESEPRHSLAGHVDSDLVRTSRLAVAACALAGVSFLLLPGLIRTFLGGPSHPSRQVYQVITLAISLTAALFGIVSVGRIGFSGGRLVGKGFGWAGVAAPVVQGALLLLFILPSQPRTGGFRMLCSNNLLSIGRAMQLYANDYADELPRAGGRNAAWGRTADWMASDRRQAYGLQADGSGGEATIGSCFYLLVKYTEVTPKDFLCLQNKRTREEGVTEFRIDTYRLRDKRLTLIDLWDFGPDPTKHCSYAYQMVYTPHTLTISSEPGLAVAADRNPWMDAPAAKARDFSLFTPDIPPFNGTADQARQGNTSRHQAEGGQNVPLLDSHVSFKPRPYCGLENDNIYTSWEGMDKIRGRPPKFGSQPADARDSLLVNDPPAARR